MIFHGLVQDNKPLQVVTALSYPSFNLQYCHEYEVFAQVYCSIISVISCIKKKKKT